MKDSKYQDRTPEWAYARRGTEYAKAAGTDRCAGRWIDGASWRFGLPYGPLNEADISSYVCGNKPRLWLIAAQTYC